MRILFIPVLAILLSQCHSGRDYYELPTYGAAGLNTVIEIPAGTNHKLEYQEASRQFALDRVDGRDRVVQFLPYPANYGFIPGTKMDVAQGGDGDPLDVLVLCESLPSGTVIETRVIATLLLRDQGAVDTKIIAIPSDSSLQVFPIKDFRDFLLHQDAARQIIETWFLHYKGPNQTQLIRWEDEAYAREEINRWSQSRQ